MRTIREIIVGSHTAIANRDGSLLMACVHDLRALGNEGTTADSETLSSSDPHTMVDFRDALEQLHRSIELVQQSASRGATGDLLLTIGNVDISLGNFVSATEIYHRALGIFDSLNEPDNIAGCLLALGNCYFSLSDYPRSLEYSRRALASYEASGDQLGIARVTCNIGVVYASIGETNLALEHYLRSAELHEQINNTEQLAGTLGNIGNVYADNGELEKAMPYFRRSLSIFQDLGSSYGIALTLCNMTNALRMFGKVDEAGQSLAQLDPSLIENKGLRTDYWINSGKLHLANGDLDAAEASLNTALPIAIEASLRSEAASIHELLREIAQHRNDLAAYIEHNTASQRINEEIRGKEATQRIAIMEAEQRIAAERQEHEKHLAVLHSTLPKHIADRVVRGEQVNDHFDNAAVMFADIVGFTTLSASLSASEVVALLEQLFSSFDAICERHNVTKVKTIGDSYMAVAFEEQPNNRITEQPIIGVAERVALAALDMISAVSTIILPNGSPEGSPVRVRIGIHSGTLTAGVIGTQRLQYDVWGDTVNVASRLESTSEPGRIHVSEDFALALKGELAHGTWHLALRGDTELKGKGTVTTYWLEQYT